MCGWKVVSGQLLWQYLYLYKRGVDEVGSRKPLNEGQMKQGYATDEVYCLGIKKWGGGTCVVSSSKTSGWFSGVPVKGQAQCFGVKSGIRMLLRDDKMGRGG